GCADHDETTYPHESSPKAAACGRLMEASDHLRGHSRFRQGHAIKSAPAVVLRAFRRSNTVPERGMGLLHGPQLDRDAIKLEVLSSEMDAVLRKRKLDDRECFVECGLRFVHLLAVEHQLDRRPPAPDPHLQAAMAQMIEHGDFLGET